MWGTGTLRSPTEQTLLDDGNPQGEVALVNCRRHRLTLKVQLDIAIFPGCYGRLKGKRDLSIYVGRLSRYQRRRGNRMHVGRVELGHHNAVCPGRVGHAKPEYAILKTCPCVDQVPRNFFRAWTISSPLRGGGRSSLLLRGLYPSGSL